MIELFPNINNNIKKLAAATWSIAMSQTTPASAADFLNIATEYCKTTLTEEEVDFLQFYFQTQMEMNKQ